MIAPDSTPDWPLPRLVPERPFPAYSYVPGKFPHPHGVASGHELGLPQEVQERLAADWEQSASYRFGLDLFNHGYYWEAHEAWEQVWHAVGHESRAGVFLKGLIKLAAAGVKAREGRRVGVARHLARARELFAQAAKMPPRDDFLGGMSLAWLKDKAAELGRAPEQWLNTGNGQVLRVFPVVLWPE